MNQTGICTRVQTLILGVLVETSDLSMVRAFVDHLFGLCSREGSGEIPSRAHTVQRGGCWNNDSGRTFNLSVVLCTTKIQIIMTKGST